jgi:streptogramin lyase/O-glycosyl hydrolase
MRKHSRWSHLIIFFTFCLLTIFLPACTNAPNPPIQIRFNTGDSYTFEGWGTSLAWWAEAVGGWPDAKRAALENALFNPGTGLGLNIIRYNFGAGTPTDNTCGGFRPFGSIPTYEPIPSNNFVLDPNQDKAQLTVLKDARGIIMPSEAIFEGFANSAPSWMLENGCTKGNGAGNNLKASQDPATQVTYEQDYANYLATIIKQFHDNTAFGQTTFRTVEPFNEPDLPWNDKGMGSQEGMHVSLDQQERVIQDLYAALKANGALSYTSISAPDDNNIVNTICSYKNSPGCTYQKGEGPYNAVIQNDIYQLNTHSYNGNDDDRVGFSSLTQRPERKDKPAWMSEYTTNGTDNLGPKCSISAERAMLGALQLSCQITRDLSLMRPTAWVYWQAVDSGGFGLLQTSDGNLATESFNMTKQYYALWQYSHFIRPGDQIIEGGLNSASLAAMDPISHQLVIVTTNLQSTNEEVTYDLSNFSGTPGSVTACTTTAQTSSTHPPTRSFPTLQGKQFSTTLPGASITTFVIPTTSTPTPMPTASCSPTPTGTITEYPLSISGSGPEGITAGPDGNLWFTELYTGKIGKIGTGGTITEYTITTNISRFLGITAGPDGNLWFTELYPGIGKIGKITPGGTITEYPLSSGSSPNGITSGPDGNLWFTESGTNKIGKITPGGTITEYPLSSGSSPNGITSGPDGNLWFTESGANKIGKITPGGTITESQPIPTSSSGLGGITAGPDGNLWFTECNGNKIGKITPGGTITESQPIPTSGSCPSDITAGSDGNLWFTEGYTGKIGKITP